MSPQMQKGTKSKKNKVSWSSELKKAKKKAKWYKLKRERENKKFTTQTEEKCGKFHPRVSRVLSSLLRRSLVALAAGPAIDGVARLGW